MELLIFNLFFWIIFYVSFGLAHGYIAKQLEFMQAKTKPPDSKEKSKKYKGKWHLAFAFSRVVIHLGLPLSFYLLGVGVAESIALLLIGATIGILLFDSMINIARGLGISWKYIGTCEGSWDGDCLWLKIDKIIPHLLFKLLLVIGSIIFYFTLNWEILWTA